MSDFLKHYKHKTIARFSVGPHHFVNHILVIDSEEKDEDFKRELAGLLMVDQINIVEVMNLENERPVDLSQRTTRGTLGTAGIKLQDSTAEAKTAELAKRAEELTEREAIIAAAERRIAASAVAAENFDGTQEGDGVVTEDAKEEPAAEPEPTPAKAGGLKLGGTK